jgi:hypothetical protein
MRAPALDGEWCYAVVARLSRPEAGARRAKGAWSANDKGVALVRLALATDRADQLTAEQEARVELR